MTACWSTGSNARYPYYLCPKRGCDSYGKSIKRDQIEGEFEKLLRSVQPTDSLFKVARAMFEDLWNRRLTQAESQTKALSAQLVKVERQVAQFLERILDASVPSVVTAYEERVRKLEEEKLLIKERMANMSRPARSFDETLRTALEFIASPWKLWESKRLEDQRTVLKLTFADQLRYQRNKGFRTANLSLPFNVIGGFPGGESKLARLDGATSNELFEILADWNTYLEHRKSHDAPVPPCP